jgi:hypothetical protein
MAQIRHLPAPYSIKKVNEVAGKIEKIDDKDIDTKTIAGMIRLTYFLMLNSAQIMKLKIKDVQDILTNRTLESIARLNGKENTALCEYKIPDEVIDCLCDHLNHLNRTYGHLDPESPLFPKADKTSYSKSTLYNHLEKIGGHTIEHFKRSGLAYYAEYLKKSGVSENEMTRLLADCVGLSERQVGYLRSGYMPDAGNWGYKMS